MKNMKWFGIIGIIIFIYLLIKADLKILWQTITSINLLWIFPAILFFAITITINAARWKYIVNRLGVPFSLTDASKITFKSMFAEHSPGKMGEIFVRSMYLKKHSKINWSKAVFSSVFSRFVDLWVTSIEGIVAIVFLIFLFGVNTSIIIPVLIVLILIILAFIVMKNGRIMRKVLKPVYKLIMPKKHFEKYNENFNNFYGEFKNINITVIIMSLFYDLIALFTMAVSFYFIGLSLGIKFPIYLAILSEPLLTVAVSLPISFSGLGAREAVFAYLFSLININVETAIIFSLVFFILRSVMMIPGIIMILFERKENIKTNEKSI